MGQRRRQQETLRRCLGLLPHMTPSTIVEAHRSVTGRTLLVLNRRIILVEVKFKIVRAASLRTLYGHGAERIVLDQPSDCGARNVNLVPARSAMSTHLSLSRRSRNR